MGGKKGEKTVLKKGGVAWGREEKEAADPASSPGI